MNTIKKIFALLFCLILVVTTHISAVALAEDNVKVFYASFNILLHKNWVLSCYGVTVYLDGAKVAHLEQGDQLTFGAWMADNRMHELKFVADKYGIPDRTWTLGNFQNGTTLDMEIQSKRNQVKIMSYDVFVNGDAVYGITKETEEQVKLIGMILDTGLKIYTALP